ncbi:MAG: DUF3313 family protein [Pseudomonadales bacterium]
MKMMIRNNVAILLGGAILASSCATPTPEVDKSAAGDQISFDGLYPVTGTYVDKAWAHPDLDLTGYKKILIVGAGIHYRPVKGSAGNRTGSQSSREFPISEKNRVKMAEEVGKAFREELAKVESLELATAPGPDVLIVRGALLDVVSRIPPERIGRSDVYLSSIGEATLVLELIDSESNTVLVRALDRRAAEQLGMVMKSSSVTNWSEVRRLAKRWATLLRTRLEAISTNMDLGSAA